MERGRKIVRTIKKGDKGIYLNPFSELKRLGVKVKTFCPCLYTLSSFYSLYLEETFNLRNVTKILTSVKIPND